MAEWITVKEAAEQLNVSDRYIRNMAAKGKLKAKRAGNKWMIHSSLTEQELEYNGIPLEQTGIPTGPSIAWLQKRVEELEKVVSELQSELAMARRDISEASQRHDTIVMQLTRQLEQSQRMLAAHQEPWYQRWFRRERKTEGGEHV